MKILVCDAMEEEVLEKMKKLWNVKYKPENVKEEIKDSEVIVVRSATKVDKELLKNAQKLKAVIRAGVGLDNVDVNYCKEKGIKVMNTPEASTNAVAELAIGMIICLLRGAYKGHEETKKKNWIKKELVGEEICGKTLGIIGFGRIGAFVGEKAHALGMRVIAYDPKPREVEFAEFVSLDELYRGSDIISLHTILIPETEKMINEEAIGKMKGGVYLVNLARGGLIDEDAVYNALKKGKIAGAALDVYSKEEPYDGKLLELKNIFFTPHIGANTKEAQKRIGEEVIKRIKEL